MSSKEDGPKDGPKDPGGHDRDAEVYALREQMFELRQLVQRVAEASTIENVLVNGFNELSTKLQPLRDLTPQRTLLDNAGYAGLQRLHDALARPKWRKSNFETDTSDQRPEGYRAGSMEA